MTRDQGAPEVILANSVRGNDANAGNYDASPHQVDSALGGGQVPRFIGVAIGEAETEKLRCFSAQTMRD
jgi:hypothetical protein